MTLETLLLEALCAASPEGAPGRDALKAEVSKRRYAAELNRICDELLREGNIRLGALLFSCEAYA
jgi:hypothetical protein